jgi:hypothetical protein
MSAEHRIPIGSLLASIGAVLLVVSLFLDWYQGVTGWTIFEIVDLVLVGLALLAVYSLAADLDVVKQKANPGLTLVGAMLALVIVVTQVLNDPPAVAGEGGPDQEVGLWLALGGAALMVAGAIVATTRISLAVEARRREEAPTVAEADRPSDTTRGSSLFGRDRPRAGEPESKPDAPERP